MPTTSPSSRRSNARRTIGPGRATVRPFGLGREGAFRVHKQLCGAQRGYLNQVLSGNSHLGIVTSLSGVPSLLDIYMMAYGLACSRGNRIAAAGIMSGIMLQGTCDVDEYTPIIHFHGIADDALPYEGNQDFQSVSDVVSFWLNHNNIPTSSLVTTELNGGDVVRDEYTGGDEDTSVVLYTINREHDKPGGHVWFSDDIGGTNPNQILWDFLSNYSLDD